MVGPLGGRSRVGFAVHTGWGREEGEGGVEEIVFMDGVDGRYRRVGLRGRDL